MKNRILGIAALCFIACAGITGGILCYPPVPQSFEEAAALELHPDEPLPPTEHPTTSQTIHEPEIFTTPSSLSTSLHAHGISLDRAIDWTREQVVHFSGTVSADTQVLHYGAYALQSDGTLREVLADYAVPETTDGFYMENPIHTAAIHSPTKLQCIGTGVLTREIGCSALVRDGWRLLPMRSTYYVRIPIDWNASFRV